MVLVVSGETVGFEEAVVIIQVVVGYGVVVRRSFRATSDARNTARLLF